MVSFKFDRKWQPLRGLIQLYRDFLILLLKRLLANQSGSLWQNGSGFQSTFIFALYLNLSCLAKFNLSQALFKIYMKFDAWDKFALFYRSLPNSHFLFFKSCNHILVATSLANANPLFDILCQPFVLYRVSTHKQTQICQVIFIAFCMKGIFVNPNQITLFFSSSITIFVPSSG